MTINSVSSFQPYSFKLAGQSNSNGTTSLKPNADIQPYSHKLAMEIQKKEPVQKDSESNELVAGAKIDKNGTLNISTMYKGWMDSNVWYAIKPDGSGEIQTVWTDPSSNGSEIQKGKLSEVYNKALDLSNENNGTISDEDAVELVEEIKEILNCERIA